MVESRNKHLGGILAVLALVCVPLAVMGQESQVPVIAGQDPGYDACGSIGVVRGLNPKGEGFLAVRTGPGADYAMADKVYSGALLSLCDQRGSWLGVVYSHETTDCGVSTPWPRAGAYAGPCRSGWVFKKYIVGGYAG